MGKIRRDVYGRQEVNLAKGKGEEQEIKEKRVTVETQMTREHRGEGWCETVRRGCGGTGLFTL